MRTLSDLRRSRVPKLLRPRKAMCTMKKGHRSHGPRTCDLNGRTAEHIMHSRQSPDRMSAHLSAYENDARNA